MGLEKRTVKIIVIVGAVLLVMGVIIGLLLGLSLPHNKSVELEVWPRSDEHRVPMIQFRASDPGSWHPWYRRINDFLLAYEASGPEGDSPASCYLYRHDKRLSSPDCDLRAWHPCTANNYYGYQNGSPCFFLRLNNIRDWKPVPYNTSENLPDKMPEDLKQHIAVFSGRPRADAVWVSCDGENPADIENIGPIQYIPARGFPAYYYPFTNKEGYLSPLVAVLFEKPKTGVLINIVCKAWAKNINNDKHDQSVTFKLMMDRS